MASGSSSGELVFDEHHVQPPASRFEKIKLLGSGSFGQAWLVMSKISQRQYVIKEVNKSLSEKDTSEVWNEINILRRLGHVNIIRYKECFIRECFFPDKGHYVCIVMEYADAGDLLNCIVRRRNLKCQYFEETQIRNWLVQLAFALQYLHERKILHRDLKSQNIFMTKNRLLKVGDFGISKILGNGREFATTCTGTPQYVSPEILRQQKYDYKTDIWGLGCIVYELCALEPAFIGDQLNFYPKILKGEYKPIPGQFSANLAELVKVMLRTDPTRRPTAEQILGAKVLSDDVKSYMTYIRLLPEVLEGGRKDSSSSLSSAESSNSGGISLPS